MKKPYILTFAVLTILPLLTGAGVVLSQENGQAAKVDKEAEQAEASELAPQQNEQALQIVREARSKLFRHKSVQAEITQVVSLGDVRFEATGKYLSGEDFRSRLEYSLNLGQLEATFLEVSDGQILHTRRQITDAAVDSKKSTPPTIELSRRDLNKILRETQLHLDQPDAVRAAEIGIGGLPAILASLERTMIFEAVRDEVQDGQPVWVVQGSWNPEEENRLVGGLGGLATQIQQFLPDRVHVVFNKETYFPQKFQYLKRISEERNTFRPLLTVSFSNAVFDESIPAQRFSYIPPPGMEERDETAMFIDAIQAASKPAVSAPEAE